jgi:hypothetical protein
MTSGSSKAAQHERGGVAWIFAKTYGSADPKGNVHFMEEAHYEVKAESASRHG